ncbi:hypothetical protein [Nonomuraea sp. NPDC049480]|uniref:hypothetical protein n=1 Tax=Nonomuraea sp. NPDC049480 TaxID=3364353 RepID=UPI0037BC5066
MPADGYVVDALAAFDDTTDLAWQTTLDELAGQLTVVEASNSTISLEGSLKGFCRACPGF